MKIMNNFTNTTSFRTFKKKTHGITTDVKRQMAINCQLLDYIELLERQVMTLKNRLELLETATGGDEGTVDTDTLTPAT